MLAGRAVATPKLADGIVEAIRLTRIARNGAVKAHTQAIVTLKATLVTAEEELRSALEPLSDFKLMTACAALDTSRRPADPAVAMRHVLRSIARRWIDLHDEIKLHTKRLDALTAEAAPELVATFGIGPDIAGELLVAAGDNTDRVRSEAAFAKLCGVCPIPTGVRQNQRSAPSQPRRQPTGQRRPLPLRHRPHAMARPDHRLRHPTHRRRTDQERHHPLPQALRRSRGLRTAPSPRRRATRQAA